MTAHLTRRELTRAATVDEIKQTALALMRRTGTTNVVFSDIAREMHMTAPALYRYFADRDDLLTALITDTYGELGVLLADSSATVPDDDPGGRLVAMCQAYRRWANEHPERYELLFGLPAPGYAAPEQGPTTDAAKRALGNFMALYHAARAIGYDAEPQVPTVSAAVATEFGDPVHQMDDMPPQVAAGMIHCWSLLQGFISLEAFCNLSWFGDKARDDLFVQQLQVMASMIALPPPKSGWDSAR